MWRGVRRILFTVLLGGLLSATLVRFAPGFDADEDLLDVRRSEESLQKLRDARRQEHNIVLFYGSFLGNYLKGDLGQSRLFQRPVSELFSERILVTLASVSLGLLTGWITALLGGLVASRWKNRFLQLGTRVSAAILHACRRRSSVSYC